LQGIEIRELPLETGLDTGGKEHRLAKNARLLDQRLSDTVRQLEPGLNTAER
jgi:hypothetical protein